MAMVFWPRRCRLAVMVVSFLLVSAGCSAPRRLTLSEAARAKRSQAAAEAAPQPPEATATRLDSLALVPHEPAPADAIAAAANASACEDLRARSGGSRCSPVHTGPVDRYVQILDSGIPRFPQYPPLALAKGVEGMVRVRALVGTDGSLCEMEVVDGPKLLWDAALQAAREANIVSAMKDGCPVPIWVVIPFEFTLPERPRSKKSDRQK